MKLFLILFLLSMALAPLLFFSQHALITPVVFEPPLDIGSPYETNPLSTTYVLSGESIPLHNGIFTRPIALGSASQERIQAFGEPSYGDLDADGDEDAVLFLTQEGGGSGVFYYVAVALREGDTYRGTNALFLGDRIAPQTINIQEGKAVANFATRNEGESFAVPPSMGKSVLIHLDAMSYQIREAVQEFGGEEDISHSPLTQHTWKWVRSESDGVVLVPQNKDAFTLTFGIDGNARITTDCNTMSGQFDSRGYSITFNQLASTLMYCEGSQEAEFVKIIHAVHAYSITDTNELELRFGKSGVATFVLFTKASDLPPQDVPSSSHGGCVVGGCSGQLCTESSEDIATTCEWRDEYACYQKATCERQPSGKCGWTDTPTLQACIVSKSSAQ